MQTVEGNGKIRRDPITIETLRDKCPTYSLVTHFCIVIPRWQRSRERDEREHRFPWIYEQKKKNVITTFVIEVSK